MARTRRAASTPRSRRRTTAGPTFQVSPDVVRSLVGIGLLVSGVVILIGLMAFAFYNDILRVIGGWG